MGIDFLGSKKQLAGFIMDNIANAVDGNCHTFFDVFSGTGSVSAAFKRAGHTVVANDFLHFTSCLTKAILLNSDEPRFDGLRAVLGSAYDEDRPYDGVLRYLNDLRGVEGFIYHNYSPASAGDETVARMYFTEGNARKIDAVRATIEDWTDILAENEKALLIADLINATSAVSNIAGTYGCYMKFWKPKALQELCLEKSVIVPGGAEYRVYCGDANTIIGDHPADVVYADPPYTKRQYSAYYHILETICRYDNPPISGNTGLRRWQEDASAYCYRRKAPGALADLLSKARCRYFVLSYNNEGQIPHTKIREIMEPYGKLSVFETRYRRYKSSALCQKESQLIERLYILQMRNHHDAD